MIFICFHLPSVCDLGSQLALRPILLIDRLDRSNLKTRTADLKACGVRLWFQARTLRDSQSLWVL